MGASKLSRSYAIVNDLLTQLQDNFVVKTQFFASFFLHYTLKPLGISYNKFPVLHTKIYDTYYQTRKNTIDFWIILRGYEQDIAEFLYDLPDKGGVFIDVGAHIGRYSSLMGRKKWEVYSFEPMKGTYEQLLLNIKLNNIGDNFHGYNYALGNASETKNIYYQSHKTGEASFNHSEADSISEEVKIDSFENLVKDDFTDKDIILKIDVEGFESSVLEGMRNLIKKSKPMIIIELWDENAKDIIDFLYGLGYVRKGAVYWFPSNSPHLKYFQNKYSEFRD